jgi:hypothetical protein
MPEDTTVLQKQEPYFRMKMSKKTGKFPHIEVEATFLVPFNAESIKRAKELTYKEMKEVGEMLSAAEWTFET